MSNYTGYTNDDWEPGDRTVGEVRSWRDNLQKKISQLFMDEGPEWLLDKLTRRRDQMDAWLATHGTTDLKDTSASVTSGLKRSYNCLQPKNMNPTTRELEAMGLMRKRRVVGDTQPRATETLSGYCSVCSRTCSCERLKPSCLNEQALFPTEELRKKREEEEAIVKGFKIANRPKEEKGKEKMTEEEEEEDKFYFNDNDTSQPMCEGQEEKEPHDTDE